MATLIFFFKEWMQSFLWRGAQSHVGSPILPNLKDLDMHLPGRKEGCQRVPIASLHRPQKMGQMAMAKLVLQGRRPLSAAVHMDVDLLGKRGQLDHHPDLMGHLRILIL